jgi:hypothetical protein
VRNLITQNRATNITCVALCVKASFLGITARLVAPPMMCYNQAGTGTAARAVGLGVRSAARIAARSTAYKPKCQLYEDCKHDTQEN